MEAIGLECSRPKSYKLCKKEVEILPPLMVIRTPSVLSQIFFFFLPFQGRSSGTLGLWTIPQDSSYRCPWSVLIFPYKFFRTTEPQTPLTAVDLFPLTTTNRRRLTPIHHCVRGTPRRLKFSSPFRRYVKILHLRQLKIYNRVLFCEISGLFSLNHRSNIGPKYSRISKILNF